MEADALIPLLAIVVLALIVELLFFRSSGCKVPSPAGAESGRRNRDILIFLTRDSSICSQKFRMSPFPYSDVRPPHAAEFKR